MKNLLCKASWALIVGSVLLTSMACPGGGATTTKSAGDPGSISTQDPKHCEKQSNDEAACRADKVCTWDGTKSPKCQDADTTISGKCAAIQAKKPCSDDTTCTWDDTVTPAVCKDKPAPTTVDYLELTFDAAALAEGKATGNSIDISAIGRNGDGSLLYFGTDTRKNEISSLDPTNLATPAAHVATQENTTHDDTPGKGEFQNYAGGDRTVIKSIVPGPDARAVVSLTGIDTHNGGVLEMDGNVVRGAWISNDAHLNVTGAADNSEVSNIQVMGDKWMAFTAVANATGGHFVFGAVLAQAGQGPVRAGGPALGVTILASAVKGNDLYVGFERAGGGPTVVKTTVAKVGNAYTLTGSIDVDHANSIIERADVKAAAGGGNHNDKISTMAMAGDHLLIGFALNTGSGSGGLAIYDVVGNALVAAPVHDQWVVSHIGVSEDGKSAIISTDKGLLLYAMGKLFKIENGQAADVTNLSVANVSATQQIVINGALPGTMALDHVTIGAVNIGNQWFIATDDAGIFRAVVATKTKTL